MGLNDSNFATPTRMKAFPSANVGGYLQREEDLAAVLLFGRSKDSWQVCLMSRGVWWVIIHHRVHAILCIWLQRLVSAVSLPAQAHARDLCPHANPLHRQCTELQQVLYLLQS